MYLILNDGDFGFNDTPTENSIEISLNDYYKFFDLQSQGKQFKLKSTSTGVGLFDYIEEYVPTPIVAPKSETELLKEEINNLKIYIAEIVEQGETGSNTTKEAIGEVNEIADPS